MLGNLSCHLIANMASNDERKKESLCLLQITDPLPVPASRRSVNMIPTGTRSNRLASDKTFSSSSQFCKIKPSSWST
ncbi:hypothetical protein OGAPHI_003482 [Ogataea philodendri]|uniref:Uncharacterized protein n=1 Tax=Ogataea philodendri TaxID=1378263 RepID=A0A9P8T608_9ASCO|nr:uncharacterized protein OGAPHI_003482 [Ogataea philodendri]KAH3666486.1 hypothetical protein OGAPHI_003482 [Ogataea philodendri]